MVYQNGSLYIYINNNNPKGVDNRKFYTIEKNKTNKYLDKNKVELNFNNSRNIR